PVANATITPGPPAHQVRAGDPVTLRCSVQVGSAPVTFTWLRDGRELAQGPLLELGDVDRGHSGRYQCVATNQVDGHRVFRALSPELALMVTTWGHGDTVFTGVVGSLLFLVLLLGVIAGFHWCHRMAPGKVSGGAAATTPLLSNPPGAPIPFRTPPYSHRAPPDPLAPLGEDPQATYAELLGPRGQPWEPSDIYDNLQ
ncbi:MUC18 protein, partial [Edolisoma coerulescens]|nr:MUC18 protein [Edolisoma coerulescens]